VFLLVTSISPFALEYGLNCNAPIIASTGQITGSTDPDVMKATGAQWVRVNFILGPWTAPDDATQRGPENLTWFETYDRIVDGYVSRGVQVYGLIGAESVADASRERLNTEGFTADLTANTLKIIGHFRDRVRVYEIFNEPNDWAGGTSSQVEPRWLARYMESVYQTVKIDNGHDLDPTWQAVTLVTGPLFTHDLDPGGPYLSQVFQAGTTEWQWESIRSQTGTYPFDGVGIHLYVKQGYEPDSEVIQYLQRNLDSVWGALTTLEGSSTAKKLFISEFGWHSGYTNEATQAQKMDIAFDLFETDDRIKQAHWFTLVDWAGNNWGIYRQEPYVEANRKPSYAVFVNHASRAAPVDGAVLLGHTVPVWFEPGQSIPVSIAYRNTGTSTWIAGSGLDRPFVLTAGALSLGFPESNAFPWSGFVNGGVSLFPTEQQAYLAEDATPGSDAAFAFNALAPDELPRGPKPFLAGMRNHADSETFGTPLIVHPLVTYRSESVVENGDFEAGTLDGWTSFGQVDGVIEGAWFAGITASRGSRFFGSAANYGQKNGGLYQTFATLPGDWYGGVVQVRTYREGGTADDTACRMGLDPAGGANPAAPGVQWSSWKESQGEWTRIGVNAYAGGDTMTLFLQARQNAPVWNVTAFDDIIVGGPAPNRVPGGFVIY
jgi:hypothetical protein